MVLHAAITITLFFVLVYNRKIPGPKHHKEKAYFDSKVGENSPSCEGKHENKSLRLRAIIHPLSRRKDVHS